MSGNIPHATIAATGPLTRGDFLMLLHWYADTNSVPEVVGIRGLSRLTRLALILGRETGLDREIQPYFSFHAAPGGGVASVEVWSELLSLRSYQIVHTDPTGEPMPPEELAERRFLLERHIPPHEHADFPLPAGLERDVLTNKGTFFAAKREDQLVGRRIAALKTVAELNRLSLPDLSAQAMKFLPALAAR